MKVCASIISFLLCILMCGCSEREALIAEIARRDSERRITQLIREKQLACHVAALRNAEAQVDSIIREMDISPLKDTLYAPDVPDRPAYIPTDSSVFKSKNSVKPLF